MSFTCNDCRIKQRKEHGLGYPFMGISYGKCEDCGKVAECEDLHETRRGYDNPLDGSASD